MANGTNSNTPSENIETPSFTAFCVALSYLRSLKTSKGLELHQEEAELINKILTTVLENEKFSMMWALKYTLFYLPYWLQSLIIHRFTETGYDSHILGRKLLIRKIIDRAVNKGVDQVVFLGAGYDTAGLIKAKQYQNVNFFELDKTGLDVKDTALYPTTETKSYKPENLYSLKCDVGSVNLKSDIEKSNKFDKNKKTLFIGEGLTMYLSEEENINLLNNLKNIVADCDNVGVLLSFVRGKDQGVVARNVLRKSNESYRFNKEPKNVPKFVNKYGFILAFQTTQLSMFKAVGDKKSFDICNQNIANNSFHPDEECFYFLKPSKLVLNQKIEDVQTLNLTLIKQI